MFITVSRRNIICLLVAEVLLTGVAPLGAVNHICIIIIITKFFISLLYFLKATNMFHLLGSFGDLGEHRRFLIR